MMEFAITITDAAFAIFERLTGQMYSRSRHRQDKNWGSGKARTEKLIQLFGDTIDTIHRALVLGRNPFAALDLGIG